MTEIIQVFSILITASAVMFGMYLTVKTFVQKELDKTKIELSKKNNEILLPIRLQAYERISLFLERISLNNLVLRVNDSSYNAAEFHARLLSEIRDEFNHNLSQQIYMSDKAWNMVRSAAEQTSAIINQASSTLPDKSIRGIELAKAIFNTQAMANHDPIQETLLYIKNEIRQSF